MDSHPPKILVVGYSAFDVTIPFAGLPVPDSKHEVQEVRLGGGGPGATAAIALTKLGARVSLVTPLTDDLPGRLQEQELLEAGVDLQFSPLMSGHRSARAVILVDSQQEQRTIFWSRGDLPALDPGSIDPACMAGADLFYVDGHEFPAAMKLVRVARELGIPIVMDAGSVREGSRELAGNCTDVISSETFAPDLMKTDDPVLALRRLAGLGPSRVAMTFGGGGVLALQDGLPVAIPAYDLPIVDTTGAGDVFHAGYAFARALGWDFLDCLRLGAATAGLKCGNWGGRSGIPDFHEAVAVMKQGGGKPLDPRIEPFGAG